MPKRTKGRGANSAEYRTDLARAGTKHAVPDWAGFTDEEVEIWHRLTSTRVAGEIDGIDQVLMVKAVRLEADSERLYMQWRETGPIIRNQKGRPIANPLLSQCETLMRLQMTYFRTMQITGGDNRARNADATRANMYEAILAEDDGLLAKP